MYCCCHDLEYFRTRLVSDTATISIICNHLKNRFRLTRQNTPSRSSRSMRHVGRRNTRSISEFPPRLMHLLQSKQAMRNMLFSFWNHPRFFDHHAFIPSKHCESHSFTKVTSNLIHPFKTFLSILSRHFESHKFSQDCESIYSFKTLRNSFIHTSNTY